MPAPFVPVHIPFISGVRQDLGSFASENPAQLRILENVALNKRGHIKMRAGARSRTAPVLVDSSTLAASVAAATAGLTVGGVVSTQFSSTEGTESPLLYYQGGQLFRRDGLWMKAGQMLSFRRASSAALQTYEPPIAVMNNPIPVGAALAGIALTVNAATGLPVLGVDGEVQYVTQGATTGYAGNGLSGTTGPNPNGAVAGNAAFWVQAGTGNVYVYFPGTAPAYTASVIAATGTVAGTQQFQAISAVLANDGFYYVAFISATAGRITLLRLNAAGAVTQTLNVSGLGTVAALGLSHSGANRLGLAWRDSAGPTLKTKVFTVIAGTMADAAIDLTLGIAPMNTSAVTSDTGKLHAGNTAEGAMSVLYSVGGIGPDDCYVGGRSYTAATELANWSLIGSTPPAACPLFAGQVVGGRTLVGIQWSLGNHNRSSQWIVLDITGTGPHNFGRVVASGAANGSGRITPSSVYSSTSQLSFAVPDGITFQVGLNSVPEAHRAAVRVITLTPQPVQAAHALGNAYLTGNLTGNFDGTRIHEDHFIEETPFIDPTGSAAGGVGTLTAGSYSYQVTWEVINGLGQVIRSGASNIYTNTGVLLNQKVTIAVNTPVFWEYSEATAVRTRLWATVVNPTPGADKYFVTENLAPVRASYIGGLAMIHGAPVNTGGEVLYEGATILADMRAPGSDRGITYANERLWVADERRVYASKLLRPGIAPAWNTEGPLTLELPSSVGRVQGLGMLGDRLVVVCASGVAVVSGNGFDDTGAGVGWAVDKLDGAPGAGNISPRGVVSIPQGVAYTGFDGDIWLVQPDYSVAAISRPVRDGAVHGAVDLSYIPGRLTSEGSTNPVLMATGDEISVWRVLDLEAGQWSTWRFDVSPEPLYFAGVNGIPWTQVLDGADVWSVDDVPGLDLGDPVNAHIRTGVLRPADQAVRGWGRIRGASIVAIPKGVATLVQMKLLADADERVLMDKTQTYTPLVNTKWPDDSPEFRATQQRAGFVVVDLNVANVDFEWKGLDLWVANSGEPQPSRTRS